MTKETVNNSLAVTHPDLAVQAVGWNPNSVTKGSSKKLEWKCSSGHIYKALVKARVSQNSGCPYCAGRKVLAGFNDLSTTHPNIANEAHGWDPTTISLGSHKNLEWKCSIGHSWNAPVHHRTGKQARICPYCNGREVLAGFNDVATTDPELIVQADGWDPTTVYNGSGKKLAWICQYGHRWRASASERTRVKNNKKTGCPICSWNTLLSGFNDLASIDEEISVQADGWDPSKVIANSGEKKPWICSKGHKWNATIRIRQREKTGCPICSNHVVMSGVNDLKTIRPDLAEQAEGWDPTKVGEGSNKKLLWKCSIGHTWKAVVASRTKLNNGCPVCGRKILLKGFNDLLTLNPEIAKEAHGWDPSEIINGSAKKLNWKCLKGHTWEARARNRVHLNTGCPVCSNNLIISGVNDLETVNPKLAAEADGWDPSKVSPGSETRLAWKCLIDDRHKWVAKVYSRKHGNDCPFCSNQKTLPGVNDLLTTHPELAIQAVDWDPTMYTAGSERVVNWRCEKFADHIWKASIKSRKKANCPYCSHNTLLSGFNDFASRYPDLAKEAHGWDPSKFISGRGVKRKWQCTNDQSHIWKTTITSRISGSVCPTCNPLGGFNPMNDGYLYFLRHEYWSMLQIGITNNPEVRLKTHAHLGWEVIEVRGPMDGYLTRDWETSILRFLKVSGASLGQVGSSNGFDGHTESWLEDSFPVTTLRELMNLVDDFEEMNSEAGNQ